MLAEHRALRLDERSPMIELTVADGVAEVVLNAPDKLNALDPAAIAELSEAYGEVERLAGAGDVRALVLRGEGRAFCAGRDISGVDPRDDDVLGYLGGLVQPLLERIASLPVPTFAVAHGACLGVGLGLLIASDIVYVADTAKIGSPFANLGATLDSGGHALFVQAFIASKALVAALRDDRLGLWQSMAQENREQAALCDTADYREGFAAFQQKRKPEFTGRG
jgi:2-(1,2-epoxy-1,2-dihydrophenyl)acetyl-CoA isomerase